MRITVSVTQDDINRGCAGNTLLCPVALAIKRHLPGVNVRVGHSDIRIDGCETGMPARVRRFIRDFDNARRTRRPFSFDLDVPDHLLAAVARG